MQTACMKDALLSSTFTDLPVNFSIFQTHRTSWYTSLSVKWGPSGASMILTVQAYSKALASTLLAACLKFTPSTFITVLIDLPVIKMTRAARMKPDCFRIMYRKRLFTATIVRKIVLQSMKLKIWLIMSLELKSLERDLIFACFFVLWYSID